MLRAVVRDVTLTERAQQQLEELIVNRSLRSGDRLPSEKEMGNMLGVSRTVVREAIRVLSAKGLVEARTGSGIYVKEIDSKLIHAPMKLLLRSHVVGADDIMEVREMLEMKIVNLAAGRAGAGDIEAMEESIRAFRKSKITAREAAEADIAFHSSLAAATKNPLFPILVNSMNDVMTELHQGSFRLDSAGSIRDSIFHHSQILERVKAKDVEGARRAMEAHLKDSREWTRRVAEGLNGNGGVKE